MAWWPLTWWFLLRGCCRTWNLRIEGIASSFKYRRPVKVTRKSVILKCKDQISVRSVIRNAGDTARQIFTSHSWSISRIEDIRNLKRQVKWTSILKVVPYVLQHPMEGNDTWSFSHPALYDNHSWSTKAHNNYSACFTIYKCTAKMACNPILKIEDQLLEW